MEESVQRLGEYRLLRVLGRGGMGTVHLAEHEPSGSMVALKVLSPALAVDDAVMRRFELEREALARVDHPGVVRSLSGIQRDGGSTFFALEHVDGRTLESLLRDEAPLSAARAVRLARAILSALAAAHDVGIVHRDVKPSNVLVVGDPPGEAVKILDFGLARLADATRLTTTGQVMGTLHYMSPEQCEGARSLDARSDVYSTAAVVFEMLAGRPPFEADTPVSLLRSHVVRPAPDLAEIRDDIPPELARLVADCLAKRPEDRPPGAKAVIERLDAVPSVGDTVLLRREAPTVAAFPVAPTAIGTAAARNPITATAATVVAGPASAAPRRRGLPWPALAVIGLLLAVALAFALGRERGRDDGSGPEGDVSVGAAAVIAELEAALRTSDYDAFQAVVVPELAARAGGADRFRKALSAVDAADFSRGFVVGDMERGRMNILIKGAALPAALGMDATESEHGIRLEVERQGDAWRVISAAAAGRRAGDADRARASAENAVMRAMRPPQLKRTLEMAGIERVGGARREEAMRFLQELREGGRVLGRIQFDLDVENFDPSDGTWRVEVAVPELTEALDLGAARLELTLGLAPRRRGGKTEYRVEAARLLRE